MAKRTKIDCCHNCPDRQADPNCHGFCETYLQQKAEYDETRAEAREIYEINHGITNQMIDSFLKVQKRRNKRS